MPAFFITSTDELLLREEVASIAKGIHVETTSAYEANLSEFIRDATGISLFAESRVLWLQEVAALPSNKKTIGLLTELCAKLPDKTSLILSQTTYFEADYRKSASFKSGALNKALSAACNTRDVSLKGRALAEWVRSHASSRYQIELSEFQVQALLDGCMQMPSLVDAELRKFSLLKKEGVKASIADETFHAVLARMPGQNVRDLVDAVVARKSSALGMAVELYRSQDGGPLFFSELYRSFERLLAILTDPQYSSRPLFRGMHSFVLKKLSASARMWRPEELVRNLQLITEAEYRLRTTGALGKSLSDSERNLVLVLLKEMFRK